MNFLPDLAIASAYFCSATSFVACICNGYILGLVFTILSGLAWKDSSKVGLSFTGSVPRVQRGGVHNC